MLLDLLCGPAAVVEKNVKLQLQQDSAKRVVLKSSTKRVIHCHCQRDNNKTRGSCKKIGRAGLTCWEK